MSAVQVFKADLVRKNSGYSFGRGVRWMPVIAMLGLFLAACTTATPPAAPAKPVAENNPRRAVASALPRLSLGDAHRLGNPQAVVGIVEFSDYQCPYCREFQQQLFPQLKKEYVDSGVVRFIHMDLPLTRIHPQALAAALAAACAGAQGRFWEMHDALYENTLDPALYAELARRLKLDTAKFSACRADPVTARAVWHDVAEARRLGISGTPSFLIGRIEGNTLTVTRISQGAPSFEAFANEIEALRRQQAPVTPQTK